MTAYELAEKLEWHWDNDCRSPAISKSADMLRKQADRIAELEKQGEPVAWMQMHHKDNIPTKFSPVKVWEDDIPLYTTPQTKPLSDEEIKELNVPDGLIDPKSYYIGYDDGKKANPVKELTGGYEVLDMNEYDVTVRMTVSDWETILRKAQEK